MQGRDAKAKLFCVIISASCGTFHSISLDHHPTTPTTMMIICDIQHTDNEWNSAGPIGECFEKENPNSCSYWTTLESHLSKVTDRQFRATSPSQPTHKKQDSPVNTFIWWKTHLQRDLALLQVRFWFPDPERGSGTTLLGLNNSRHLHFAKNETNQKHLRKDHQNNILFTG